MYKPLSEDRFREIVTSAFNDRLQNARPVENPTLQFIAGQPGAGKSSALDRVTAEFKTNGGAIAIDVDVLRKRIHTGPNAPSPQETQADAGRLGDALRTRAMEYRANIIEEGTFKNPAKVEAEIHDARSKGYRVEMTAVATPLEQSLLGIYYRFERAHERGSLNPRSLPEEVHKNSAEGFGKTLDRVQHMLDRVRVMNRDGDILFDSASPGGKHANAIDALAQGRQLTDRTLQQVIDDWGETIHAARSRAAPERYVENLEAHRERMNELQRERITGHAMDNFEKHAIVLARDPRFSEHTPDEIGKAGFYRAVHEKSCGFKGIEVAFEKYDAAVSDRTTLANFPDIDQAKALRIERDRTPMRSRDDEGQSL